MPFTKDGKWVPMNYEEMKKERETMFRSYKSYDIENRPSYETPERNANEGSMFRGYTPSIRPSQYDSPIGPPRPPAKTQDDNLEPQKDSVFERLFKRGRESVTEGPFSSENVGETTRKFVDKLSVNEQEIDRGMQGREGMTRGRLAPENIEETNEDNMNRFTDFFGDLFKRGRESVTEGPFSGENIEETNEINLRKFANQYEPGQTSLSEMLQRPLNTLSDTLSFGATKAVREKLDADYGEPDNFAEQVADKIGQGLGFGIGGGAVKQVGGAVGRNVAQRGRELLGRGPLPGANPQMGRSLSQELAGLGAGAAVVGGANQFAEGWTDPEIEERNAIQEIAGNMRYGFYQNVSDLGSFANSQDWKWGEDVKSFAERSGGEEFATHYDKEFSWKSFLDPKYYTTTMAQSLPSMIATMPLGILGYGGAALAAGKLGLGAFGRTVAGAVGGASLQAPLESAMIAGGTYEEALKRGNDEETATSIANNAFWKTMAVTAVTQGLELSAMFAPVRRFLPQVENQLANITLRAGATGTMEGVQEVLQEWAVSSSLGDDFNISEAGESFGLGFVMGGAMGAATTFANGEEGAFNEPGSDTVNAPNPIPGNNEIVDPNNPVRDIQRKAKELMNDEMRAEFDEEVEAYRNNGYPDDVAEVIVWESVAMTDEGKDLINRATKDVMDNKVLGEQLETEGTQTTINGETTIPTDNTEALEPTEPEDTIDTDFQPDTSLTMGASVQIEEDGELMSGTITDFDEMNGVQVAEVTFDMGADQEPYVQLYPINQLESGAPSQTTISEGPMQGARQVNQGPMQDVRQVNDGPMQTVRQTGEVPAQTARQTSLNPATTPLRTGDRVTVEGREGVFTVSDLRGSQARAQVTDQEGNTFHFRKDAISGPIQLEVGSQVTVEGQDGLYTITDLRGDKTKLAVVDENGNRFHYNKNRVIPTGLNVNTIEGPEQGPQQTFGPNQFIGPTEAPPVQGPQQTFGPNPFIGPVEAPTEGLEPAAENVPADNMVENTTDTEEVNDDRFDERTQKLRESDRERGEIFLNGDDVVVNDRATDTLRSGVIAGHGGWTRTHSSRFVSVKYSDDGTQDNGIPVEQIVEHNGQGVTEHIRTFEQPRTGEDFDLSDGTVDEDNDETETSETAAPRYEIRELKSGKRKVVVNVPGETKQKAEFTFNTDGSLSDVNVKEGNKIVVRSQEGTLDRVGLPKDLIIQSEQNLIDALEGREARTTSDESAEIEYTDHNMNPMQVKSMIAEQWKDLPFIPDYRRRGEPVQTYFFRDQSGKEYVMFRENGKSPANPQFANVFLKTAEPMSLDDPAVDWLKDMIDQLPSQQGNETTQEPEQTSTIENPTEPIEGTTLNNRQAINEGDYIVEYNGGINIPTQVTSINPLSDNFINFADREVIHLQETDAIPENTKNLAYPEERQVLIIDHILDRLNLKSAVNGLIEINKRNDANALIKRYAPGYGAKSGEFFFFVQPERGETAARIYYGEVSGNTVQNAGNIPLNTARKIYEDNIDNIEELRQRATNAEIDRTQTIDIEEDESGFILTFADQSEVVETHQRLMNLKRENDSNFQMQFQYGNRRIIVERNELTEGFVEQLRQEYGFSESESQEATQTPAETTEDTKIEEISETENFPMPWEMSLDDFMNNDNWKVRGSKNSYYIDMPNGEQFPGGITAHGRTSTAAKKNFHENQIYYQLRKDSSVVTNEAVESYPDLKRDLENYRKVKEAITINDETVSIRVDDETKTYNIEDIPTGFMGRGGISDDLSQLPLRQLGLRNFVNRENLIGEERSNWEKGRWDIREVVGTAIAQKVDEQIKTRFNVGDTVRVPVTDGSFQNGEITRISYGDISVDTPPTSSRDTGHYGFTYPELISYQETTETPTTTEESNVQEDSTEIRALGDTDTVTTSRGTEVEVQYALVEANDLITSNNDNGSVNPVYPSDLQPRQRTRQASQDQINRLAGNLNPALLGTNPLASDGAPIIGPDLVVESGNGRAIALRRVYNMDNYAEQREDYRRWLFNQSGYMGLTNRQINSLENPILVRVRRTDIDRVQFTQEANEASVSTMSATEQALADAGKMSGGLMNLFGPNDNGELNNSTNRDFIQAFMRDVVSPSERNRLMTDQGLLSQDGLNRVRNAVFAYAYGDATAISTLSESTDNNVKSIMNQLLIAASRVAFAQDNIQNGSYYDLGINENIVEAMNTLSDLRTNNQKVDQFLSQMTMFDEMSPISKELLRFLDDYGSGKKGKPAKTISATLLEYYRGLEVLGDPNQVSLFGDAEPPTREQLLEISLRKVTGDDDLQGSLFETEAEQDLFDNGPDNDENEQGNQEGSQTNTDSETTRQQYTIGTIVQNNVKDVMGRIEENKGTPDGYVSVMTLSRYLTGQITDRTQEYWPIEQLGSIIDPSTLEPTSPLPDEPGDVDSEHFQAYTRTVSTLIDSYISGIEDGTLPTGRNAQRTLRQIANDEMGREVTEDEWRDSLEAAVQIVMSRRIAANPEMSLQERIIVGNELEQLMKNTGRSLEQMERQQYSTPLSLAQIATFALDPRANDVVKEGSAGTGSLILPLNNQVEQIKAVELSPRRAAILQKVSAEMETNVTIRNANTFDYKPRATAVIGNPPFKGQNVGGKTVKMSGKAPWGAWGDLGNRFLLWDLQRSLQDGGRLAYIVSPGVIDNKQNSPFRKWLRENHTVRAFIKFPAGVYDTRGTKFGAGLIVVDKGKVADIEPITGEPQTLEELEEMLSPLRGEGTHGRTQVESVSSTQGNTTGNQGSGSNAEVGGQTSGGRRPSGTTTGGGNSDGVEQPSSSGTRPTNSDGTGGQRGSQTEPTGNGNGAVTTDVGEQSDVSEELPSSPRNDKSDEISTIPENPNAVGQIIDELPSVTRYVPRRRVTNSEHPGIVIEAPGMQFVNMPEQIFTENKYLPHPKVIEGGKWKLSDVQIESLMAAKYNFLEHEKRGILIADDTGMGKTAQLLGIAADGYHSGRTSRVLIITTKDQVAIDNFLPSNDNFNLDLPITLVDPDYSQEHDQNFKDKTFKDEPDKWKPLDIGDGVLLMSQYTFKDSQEAVKKWLNEVDGDVMVLVDESHVFKNVETVGGRALKDLTIMLGDKAQINYASATAAEELEGLEHLYGLKLWGLQTFNEFEAKLTGLETGTVSGGKKSGMAASMNKKSPFARDVPLTMMEQITREMKMNGQYIGRQLSMEGVTMDGMTVNLSNKDKGDWNRAVQFLQLIAEKAEEHGRKPTERGRIMGSVVGYMRRLRGYYALKGIIADIKAQQKAGTFKRFAISAFYVNGDEGEPAQLQNAINVINDTAIAEDGSGEEITVFIPEAVDDKADLMAILQGLNPEWGESPVPEIPSPIDMMYQAFGEDNVAVVHGKIKRKDRSKFVKQFQDGKKPIIWFNGAGATGVDMHDTIGERIRFYHQDYPYAAKDAKQAEGRVNRTNQVTTPNYVYPYLDTSVDSKFVGTLMARYESMGALSRGDTAQLGGEELSSFDFTGKAAEEAAYRIIPLLDPDMRAKMFGNWTRDMFSEPGSELDETNIRSVYGGKVEVKKFMNALMLLEFDEGNEVFNQFNDVIAIAKQEIEARGGMVDKFVTYDGEQLDVQEAKGGIKLRTIDTKLTPEQEKSLKIKLRIAKENIEKSRDNLEKARDEAITFAEGRLEEMQSKQNEEMKDRDEIQEQINELFDTPPAKRDGEKINKLRTRREKLDETIRRRGFRINEQEDRIKGIQENRSDIVDKLPDLRRAQVYLDNAELRLLSAESDIERSSDIMLVDGSIATTGLLVPIRQAIRKAAEKQYKGKTVPSSALQLELRGYYLENGERVVGAVVPKWAEGEVAKALEARMRYSGNKSDIAKLKAHIQAGNAVALGNGFEIRWQPQLEQFQIWGMTPSKHKVLYEQLVGDKRSPDIGYHQRSRSFVISKDEGFTKLIERFGLAIDSDGDGGIRKLETKNGRERIVIDTPNIPNTNPVDFLRLDVNRLDVSESGYEYKRVSPNTTREVGQLLAKSMNTLFRKLKTDKKRTYGWYNPNSGGGRIRPEKATNIRVLAHEMGHAFSDKFNFKGDERELISMYEKYYPGSVNTKRDKIEEGLAEFFMMYLTDHEQAIRDAPKTDSLMNDFLALPELEKVAEAIQTSQDLISNELDGSAISQGMGSIQSPSGWRNRQQENNFGEEYEVQGLFKKMITSVYNFTIPWKDMYNEAVENGYDGLDFTKLMAISGAAKEKARNSFESRATDHRSRYIINYETSEQVPEFLQNKFNELRAKYGTVDKALQEINNRSFEDIIMEGTEIVEKRMNRISQETLDSMKLSKKELKKHGAYMVFSTIAQSYRYNERAQRGFKDNPISSDVASGIIEESRNLFPELENLIREYTHNLSQVLLTKLERGTNITAEDKARILAGSDFYIPTYYSTKPPSVGTEPSGQTAGRGVKRYRGRQDSVYDILTATLLKLTEVEQSVEAKRTLNAIEKALLNTPGMNRFGTFVPEDKVPKTISGKVIAQQIDDLLDEPIAEEAIGDMVFTIFSPGGLDTKRGQPILMNYHGKKKVYMVVAPDLFKAFLSMRPAQVSPMVRYMAKLGQMVRWTSTTLNPRYHWNAFWRDFFTAGIQSKQRGTWFHSMTYRSIQGGLMAAGLGNERAQRVTDSYMASGAFMSSAENVLGGLARSSITDGLRPTKWKGLKKNHKGFYFLSALAPGNILQVTEQIQRYPEFEATVMRLSAEYDIDPEIVLDGRKKIPRGKEEIVDKIMVEAAYAASEVTTNFSLHGTEEFFKSTVSSIPFLHGTLQGQYREGRQMKNNPMQTGVRLMLMGVPMTVIAWALLSGHDEEDFSDETKDRYWILPLNPLNPNSRLKISIAKPFSYAVPLNFLERALDSELNEEEQRNILKNWWNPVRQAFFDLPLAPPLISSMLDVWANKAWHGGDIVPMGDENLLTTEQYDPLRTSTLSKAVSNWLTQIPVLNENRNTISPRKIDYFLNNAIGGIGEAINIVGSKGIEMVSDNYERPPGQKKLSELINPFAGPAEYNGIVGGMLYGPNEGGSRTIDNFYKQASNSDKLVSTAKRWAEEAEKQYNADETRWTPPQKVTDKMIIETKRNAAYKYMSKLMRQLRDEEKALMKDKNLDTKRKHQMQVRSKYLQKVVANVMTGTIPNPPSSLDLTPEYIESFRTQVIREAEDAIQRESQSDGGASQWVKYLEYFQKEQRPKE